MCEQVNEARRGFIQKSVSMTTGLVLLAAPSAVHAEEHKEEVSPAEDLMREHGVLNRVLLIYEESIKRLKNNEDLNPTDLQDSASIVRTFIEDYHEKLEEDYLFPRFLKANRLVDLVDTLKKQHQVGRQLTDATLKLSNSNSLKNQDNRNTLVKSLEQFIRMYRPHESREDTVLFPVFKEIVSSNEYDSLGEEFEEKEHELFGEEGFVKFVEQVAEIEKSLDIYDLAKFTPKV